MIEEVASPGIAHVIQQAVAPVFLLSGIGAMLAVTTNRLARVMDRARAYEERHAKATGDDADALHGEMKTLKRRAHLINRCITLCTITALLVCTVVAALFLSELFRFDAKVIVSLLFIAAMVCFFAGLLSFLREIFIATANLRIGPE